MGTYAPRACSNCGITAVHAHGRCAPCWTYYERTGKERHEGLIVKLAQEKLMLRTARVMKLSAICADTVFIGPDAWTECEEPPGHIVTGKPHRSWLGEWYWEGDQLLFVRRHHLLVELGA